MARIGDFGDHFCLGIPDVRAGDPNIAIAVDRDSTGAGVQRDTAEIFAVVGEAMQTAAGPVAGPYLAIEIGGDPVGTGCRVFADDAAALVDLGQRVAVVPFAIVDDPDVVVDIGDRSVRTRNVIDCQQDISGLSVEFDDLVGTPITNPDVALKVYRDGARGLAALDDLE